MIPDEGEFRRCKIFHVVPLTFTIGFIKVIFHTAAIILILTLLMKPELIEQQESHNKVFGCLCKNKLSKTHEDINKNAVKARNNDITLVLDFRKGFINEIDKIKSKEHELHELKVIREHRITQLYWALMMTAFYLLFSLMLLHGIIAKNASNMLPFFCLQLFDLVLDILWLIGHIISSGDLNRLQVEFKCLPVSKYFDFMSPAVSCAIILMICVIFIMVKFYFIEVVWSCYRYVIASHCQVLPIHRGNAYKNGVWGLDLWQIISLPKNKNRTKIKELSDINEDALPKYEEILKTPSNAFNPPPYIEKGSDQKQ